jgi:hypothetical protein
MGLLRTKRADISFKGGFFPFNGMSGCEESACVVQYGVV